MHKEFDMSLMGELHYFLGLQINQSNAGIFIHQGKYIKDLLKRFALDHVSPKSTPMNTSVKLTKDEQGTPVDVSKFRDADYAGSQVDRKSTSGAFEFLGDCLVAWHSKKQTSVALSTTEGKYIAAGSCCAQILWMQQTLQDFGISYSNIPIYCDNTSAINISKNPVMHSHTKHIDVRHHFLRDNVSKGNIELIYISTEKQRADIFTKPLAEDRFCLMRPELDPSFPKTPQGFLRLPSYSHHFKEGIPSPNPSFNLYIRLIMVVRVKSSLKLVCLRVWVGMVVIDLLKS
ncbi:hypothetical protein AgCh_013776 [Apium graveolens]